VKTSGNTSFALLRDAWDHFFGLRDPTLDLASAPLARASDVGRAHFGDLIDRPRELIETPK